MTEPVNSSYLGATLLGQEELCAVSDALFSKELFRFGRAPTKSFNHRAEKMLAKAMGAPGAVTFSSGTAALKTALAVVGIKPGDVVLVSAFTFIATAAAVISLGATPFPIDSDEHLGISIPDLEDNISNAKAVIHVYAPGLSSNTFETARICMLHGIPLIEDSSQALGVHVNGHPAGLIGDLGVYSFQQGKQITCGEGGGLISLDSHLLNLASVYADHGAVRDSSGLPNWEDATATLGENLRLSEVQAAILTAQLGKFDQMLETQRLVHNRVISVLENFGILHLISHSPSEDNGSHVFFATSSHKRALQIISVAKKYGIIFRFVWKQPFCDLYPFRNRYPTIANRELNIRSLAPKLIALTLPPTLSDSRADLFIERLIMMCKLEGSLWQ